MSKAEDVLLGLRDFLHPYLSLVNSHNVDYLTRDHWQTYVPDWIRTEERSVDLYDLYERGSRDTSDPLESFIDQIVQWRRRFAEVTYTRERFEKEILADEKDQHERKGYKFSNRTFMTLKKEHEVDILAPVIDQIAQMAQTEAVIDYGSGRGYLGVELAHDYRRNVLGVESCEATVHSGERRQELLTRYQKELSGNEHYRTTSTLVTSETDFQQLFFRVFQSPSSSFLLCGLHACGSLSCSLIHHFVSNASVRAIVNVACCYHLLDEKFSPNPFTHRCSEDDPCSFPLSRRLIAERSQLGRNARMLAVQSFERNLADQTLNAGLWYRTLMQVILVEVYGMNPTVEEVKLGKLTKKSRTFEEYVGKAVRKLQLDPDKISSELINAYWTRYECQRHQLHTFIQLKVLFAGLLEMLILLDRLVFLLESVPRASTYLVSLFDPLKSPRRWCLISSKSKDE